MMSGDMFSFPSSVKAVLLPQQELQTNPNPKPNPSSKKRRNLSGTPDPDAEVIAFSPKSLMATNRFVCEVCNKGFQREQNLQLHRRGHNLPWKLKQRNKQEQVKKKVYICPEKTCVHHHPSRALGDLTGIKKHFSRKHGEKKWKCEKCSKKYAVQSDWKAHSKTCGTREYKCDCGTLFSRKDSFITHRAFCDALAEESSRITSFGANNFNFQNNHTLHGGFTGFRPDFGNMANGSTSLLHQQKPALSSSLWLNQANSPLSANANLFDMIQMPSSTSSQGNSMAETLSSLYSDDHSTQSAKSFAPMSATALLQKATQIGSTKSNQSTFFRNNFSRMSSSGNGETRQVLIGCSNLSSSGNTEAKNLEHAIIQTLGMQTPTRDFLGVRNEESFQFLPHEVTGFSHYNSSH